MSPILVRPVREQLEHDRIIRLLQNKFRRKYEAGINPGAEQNSPLSSGTATLFPDLVLMSLDRGHRPQVVVEVETGESVNHLEALAQWAHFSKLRPAFHLYVPAGMVEVARRLCEDNQIHVGEIWSYQMLGDQPRFALVHRSRESSGAARVRAAKPAAAPKKAASRAAKPARRGKPARAAKPKKPARAAKHK
ncbi:MAG: hypothetical protein LAO77_07235 [Acidobacteriia bacterium]|nr:hypothetical protein [Terriglobia bacterium]